MKLIIAGSRSMRGHQFPKDRLDALHKVILVDEVVSGCATGADRLGEIWAAHHGIPVKKFPADWGRHGAAAGPVRNRQMAEYAEAVVLLPGGTGTASMAREAAKAGIIIHDWRDPS